MRRPARPPAHAAPAPPRSSEARHAVALQPMLTPSAPSSSRLWIMAGVSWLLVLGSTWRVAPYAARDQVFQFKALEQYLAGQTASPNHLSQPAPEDLSRDEVGFITWWAPGPPLALLPLRKLGLPPGPALRVLALAGILFGAVGWAHWYRKFAVPSWMPVAIAVFFPWLRFASANLFTFSAEILPFAAVPWLLVAAWRWRARPARTAGVALGIGLGLLYILKYTGVFAALGCLAALWWVDRREWRRSCAGWIALGIGFALPILALTALDRHWGAPANLVTQSFRWNFSISSLVYGVANPALMLADLNSVLSWLLQHPSHGLAHGFELTAACGLGIALVLLALVGTSDLEPVEQFAAVLLVAASASLVAVWTISWGGSHEPRHLATPSLAFAPAVLACATRALRRAAPARWWRRLILGTLGVAWACPLLYGPVTVIGKTAGVARPSLTATGLRDPAVPAATQAAALDFLRAQAAPDDVWVLGFGNTTFEIPGRHVLRYFFNSDDPAEYSAIRFSTRQPLRVRLLIARVLDGDGRGPRLRAQFRGADDWTGEDVPGSDLDLWTVHLRPTPPEN